jgi:hypothetical protein
MNSPPTVSVVMSVYNGQAFLAEAIESILSQTYRDYEFVIIDDGSTDNTPDILAEYASRDARIRIHRHANKGRAESLNIGVSVAKGEYIARMDADDIALPDRLQEQMRFMEGHPEVGLIGGALELMTADGRAFKTIRYPLEDSVIRSVMLEYSPFAHPTVIVRKEVVLASGGYRKALLDADDYDLWLRMSERTQLANLERCVLRYRIHRDQVSITNMPHQTLCVLAARAAAEQRRSGRPDPLADIQEITPQVVESLGVTPQKIRTALVEAHGWWISQLKDINPEAALELVEKLTQLSHSGPFEPRILADAWLDAARIHYKQKEPARALAFAGRALLFRPSVVGHTVRDAFRVRLWHPLLNFTRPIRHTLGLRQKSVKATDKEANVHKDLADKNNVYRDWADREFAAPSPHLVKQRVLLRNSLHDATWVESGTFMGDTTSVLSKVAKMVYSIEPEPTLFSKAEQKFRNTSNVKIIKGLSEDVFLELLATIGGNVCFWLDGHYSAGVTFKGPQDTPIMDELTAIGRNIAQMGKIVVMVDDVRCFDPRNPEFSAYPPVDFLVDWARKHNLTWHIEHDIFIAKNH